MTYCVGMRLDKGLIFMSDTRTNAGVDNVSVFKKMFTWEVPGERVITVMTAGNLATTQAVISLLNEHPKAVEDRTPSILKAPSMFQVATLIGETLRTVISQASPTGPNGEGAFKASILVGGQIKGGETRLFLVYPEGNFIEASDDTPFLQVGETKYGKPIIVRAYDKAMTFEEATKLLLVSFDSTIKANLSVDFPLDMQCYEVDSFKIGPEKRVAQNDDYAQLISNGWGEALRTAFASLPDPKL